MSITIDKYTFSGPYRSNKKLEDRAGIYAIHCYQNDKYYLLDIGESARVKSRVIKHDRINCWQKHCSGTLTVSVFYTRHWSQEGRMKMVRKIRDKYTPPCSKKSDGVLNFINKNDK